MDNPSAFPILERSFHNDDTDNEIYVCSDGMSLRDYFAAQALQGFCVGGTKGDPLHTIADIAYQLADEMLKSRSKS